jgi:hypothetical protein
VAVHVDSLHWVEVGRELSVPSLLAAVKHLVMHW